MSTQKLKFGNTAIPIQIKLSAGSGYCNYYEKRVDFLKIIDKLDSVLQITAVQNGLVTLHLPQNSKPRLLSGITIYFCVWEAQKTFSKLGYGWRYSYRNWNLEAVMQDLTSRCSSF